MNAENRLRIGLWGTGKSGKTTYLAMLFYQLLSQKQQQWDVYAEDDATKSFLDHARETMYVRQRFVEKTYQTTRYHYVLDRNQAATVLLDILDTAGEAFENYFASGDKKAERDQPFLVEQRDVEPQMAPQTPNAVFEAFLDCDGLIFLLDPYWDERDTGETGATYDQMLFEFIRDLSDRWRQIRREQPDFKPPLIALVASKTDGDEQRWQQLAAMAAAQQNCFQHLTGATPEEHENALERCQRDCLVFKHLKKPFIAEQLPSLGKPGPTVRCFAISNIGRHEDNLNVGTGNIWAKPTTPPPPTLNLHRALDQQPQRIDDEYPELRTEISNVEIGRGTVYEPQSINNVERIAPYQVLEPIYWMISERIDSKQNGRAGD